MIRPSSAIGAVILSVIPLGLGAGEDVKKSMSAEPPHAKSEDKKPSFDLERLPYCFFLQEKIVKKDGGKVEIDYELNTFQDKTLEKDLQENGIIKPNEIKEAIKYINDETDKFNKLIVGKKVNLLELSISKKDEPVLKPSVSPYQSFKKYHLANSAYPIILTNTDLKQVDLKSLRIRKYIDPLDGETKEGIYFEYIFPKDPTKTENILVPSYANFAILDGNKKVHFTTYEGPVFDNDRMPR